MNKIKRIIEPSSSAEIVTKVFVQEGSSKGSFVYVFVDNHIRSTITTPKFDKLLSREKRITTLNCLVTECVKVAAEANSIYIEATPSSQMPNLRDWISVLEENSFNLAAEKVILAANSEDEPPTFERKAELLPSNLFQYEVLLKIFAQCQSQTLDRADKNELVTAAAHFQELIGADNSHDGSTNSWVAVDNMEPVGLAFLELDGDESWVPYIGVIPTKRRQGIGTTLLLSVVNEAHRRKKSLVKSLIDINNQPSIEMHLKCGFERRLNSYFIYRNVL